MVDAEQKPHTASEEKPAERQSAVEIRRPFESLRREVDRLFEDFDRGSWRVPARALSEMESFWRRATGPAVDIVEREKDYLVTAELPGLSEKDVELKLANDTLTIKGEKKEEKEEKRKGYYQSERRYGSFERSFRVPEGVDQDKIDASFNKGVLMVTMPKKPEAMKAARSIDIKPG
jgi:HSP20 family protein